MGSDGWLDRGVENTAGGPCDRPAQRSYLVVDLLHNVRAVARGELIHNTTPFSTICVTEVFTDERDHLRDAYLPEEVDGSTLLSQVQAGARVKWWSRKIHRRVKLTPVVSPAAGSKGDPKGKKIKQRAQRKPKRKAMKKRDGDETQEQKEEMKEQGEDADSQSGETEECMRQQKTSHRKPGWKGYLAVDVMPPPAKAFIAVAGPRKRVKTARQDT